jgi:hypothetical protein
MAATWNYALQFPRELMQEIEAFKKSQGHDYEKQLDYYVLYTVHCTENLKQKGGPIVGIYKSLTDT